MSYKFRCYISNIKSHFYFLCKSEEMNWETEGQLKKEKHVFDLSFKTSEPSENFCCNKYLQMFDLPFSELQASVPQTYRDGLWVVKLKAQIGLLKCVQKSRSAAYFAVLLLIRLNILSQRHKQNSHPTK